MLLNLKHKKIDLKVDPFFIAEIGFNFENDISLGKEMIAAAKESDADAVKFQSFKANKLLLPNSDIFQLIKDNELSFESHLLLKEYADKLGIDFFSTPFDLDNLKILVENINVPLIKIASGDLTYYKLLAESSFTDLPIILSTGCSTYSEIETAVEIITKNNKNLIIMHCVSNYPLEYRNANLEIIRVLKNKFKHVVGFSDHSIDSVLPIAAAALGAKVFEKHFTLSRDIKTADNPISTEPDEFKKMVEDVNNTILSLGSEKKELDDLMHEKEVRNAARRGVYAVKPINKGDVFSYENVKFVRPYNSDGLSPEKFELLKGKVSEKDYSINELIKI
jgi:N,N'-diacetyllegionaminate synthase